MIMGEARGSGVALPLAAVSVKRHRQGMVEVPPQLRGRWLEQQRVRRRDIKQNWD